MEAYKVDGWNNFCRVFELPNKFPNTYCFGGGVPVGFKMVDWFNPVSGLDSPAVSKEVWKEKVGRSLRPRLKPKFPPGCELPKR